jgi:hypothetical protein
LTNLSKIIPSYIEIAEDTHATRIVGNDFDDKLKMFGDIFYYINEKQ